MYEVKTTAGEKFLAPEVEIDHEGAEAPRSLRFYQQGEQRRLALEYVETAVYVHSVPRTVVTRTGVLHSAKTQTIKVYP